MFFPGKFQEKLKEEDTLYNGIIYCTRHFIIGITYCPSNRQQRFYGWQLGRQLYDWKGGVTSKRKVKVKLVECLQFNF